MPGGQVLDIQWPEINPSGATSANRMDIPTSPAMFGGFGAQAEEHLGAGVEKAGETGLDVLTARQQLNNEVHASELNTWLANNITDKFEQFNKLEGRAASDALPQFKKDIDQLYQDHLNQAGNSLAMRAQLAKSGRFLTDAYYRYATNYSDQQFRGWQDKTATNRASVYGAQAMVAQKNGDLQGMEVALNTSDDEVRKLYEQRGWDQDATDNAVMKNRGHNLRNIIENLSYSDPIAASALYRKYENQMDEDSSRATKASIYGRVEKAQGDQVGTEALRGTYQTAPAPAQVQPVFEQVGAKYGVPSSYLLRTWQIESGGQINPKDSPTGAKGPFQFIGSTARQYGVTNPNDFMQSTEGAARYAVDNRGALAAGLGRPPTDAELYLAHQQDAKGALKLLRNPTARAGDLVGDQAIRVNGGDPNAPASAFTGMWAAKYNGAGAAASLSRKAAAYQVVASRPDISENVRDHAITRINRDVSMQMQAEEATQQQRTLQDQDASNEYVTKMLTGKPVDTNAMANDPRLLPNTKIRLAELAENKGLTDDPMSFGPKYVDTYGRIFASGDDPSRISSVDQILSMGAPGGGLTLKGVDRLTKIYTESRNQKLGEHDPTAVNVAKSSLLKSAQEEMARQQLIPGMGPVSTNLKGERIFNSKFVPAFEAAYEDWVKKGKNPWEFLTKENVDKLMDSVYPKAQRDADSLESAGETQAPGNQPAEPTPPAPQGVNADAWTKVVGAPPLVKSGAPMRKADWAQVVQMLVDKPTPENIKLFDQSKFGAAGYRGQEILDQFKRSEKGATGTSGVESLPLAVGVD